MSNHTVRPLHRWSAQLALVLVAGLFVAILASLFIRSRPTDTVVEGHIYRGLDDHTGRYFGPLEGLVVTNDRSGSSSTTDEDGRFVLVVPYTGPDEFIQIAVRRGDKIVLNQSLLVWQPHFELDLLLP